VLTIQLGIRVIFEQGDLDTANTDNDLMIFIIESIAQAKNESRSDNIKWSKRIIDVMLSNEKYIKIVRLLDKEDKEVHYVSENNPHL